MDDLSLVVLDEVTKQYSPRFPPAISCLSVTLNRGEILALLGPSGCGKTTTLRLIAGFDVPDMGTVLLNGVPMAGNGFWVPPEARKIGMVFQDYALFPHLTLLENVAFGLHGKVRRDRRGKAMEVLKIVGMDGMAQRYPHELSGGMQQRVVIAMALLLKPGLVIADEPTTALDVLVQSQILNLFKSLKKQGVSFVLISHDLAAVSEICEKIGIMYAGKLVEFGSSTQILQNPKHPYTQALIQSIPRLHDDTKPKYIPGSPPSLINPKQGCRFIDRCSHVMDKCHKDPISTKTESGYVQCWLYE